MTTRFGYSGNMETTMKSWAARLKALDRRLRAVEEAPLVGGFIRSDPLSDKHTIQYKEIDGVYVNVEGFSVNASGASDGDVFIYDATEDEWVAKATTEFTTDIATTGEVAAATLDLDETGFTLDASYATGLSVVGTTSWNKDDYLVDIRNDETANSYGDTLFVRGGSNHSSSYIIAAQQLNGTNVFNCRGDGKIGMHGLPSATYDTNNTGSLYSTTLFCADDAYATDWNGSLEVPTKNAIYDELGAWSNVTLSFSASGTTWTPGTAPFSRYKIIGKTCFLQIETGSGNVGADTAHLIISGLPATPNSNYSDRVVVAGCYIYGNSGAIRERGHVLVDNSPAELNIFRTDFSNFTTATDPFIIHLSVFYETT